MKPAWLALCLLAAPCGGAVGDDATAPDTDARARACSRAYQREDLDFVYRHCPFEAWALARAQCERGDESVAERYAAFCRDFKNGRAPAAR